jgi:hypothetical protein
MLRYALLTVAIVVANGMQAEAQEVGRYQVVTVPLGIAGEGGGTTVLLDTQSGRTWHVMLDDKGRPRWRGIDFAGGSQGLAQAADRPLMEAAQQAGAELEAPAEPQGEEPQGDAEAPAAQEPQLEQPEQQN